MLSPSLRKSSEKGQPSSYELPKNSNNSIKSCDKENQSIGSSRSAKKIVSNVQQRRNLAYLLFICLIIAGSSIQCGESASKGKDKPPCICEGKFWKTCPRFCPNSHPTYLPAATLGRGDHDFDHPDHNEDIPIDVSDLRPIGSATLPDDINKSDSSIASLRPSSDEESIIRHRKIYVSEKQLEEEPVIHSLKITIPVTMNDYPAALIPPPKPIFKMRKYTTYETKPEVEMVPMTTTIIKPVGVSKDQFIGDKKP